MFSWVFLCVCSPLQSMSNDVRAVHMQDEDDPMHGRTVHERVVITEMFALLPACRLQGGQQRRYLSATRYHQWACHPSALLTFAARTKVTTLRFTTSRDSFTTSTTVLALRGPSFSLGCWVQHTLVRRPDPWVLTTPLLLLLFFVARRDNTTHSVFIVLSRCTCVRPYVRRPTPRHTATRYHAQIRPFSACTTA
jgi:hypothetical protein